MSTHRVDVVRIGEIEKHPNADSLGLVRVFGWTCAVRLGEWKPGDLAAYVEPDYVVPDTEQFAFLKGARRIKARRLRGTWSQGLLTKPPEGAAEGDDVMEAMGIVRYESKAEHRFLSEDAENPCPYLSGISKYDIESWQRHRSWLQRDEKVYVTEKIHGANARYCFVDGRMWVGSRGQWKKPPAGYISPEERVPGAMYLQQQASDPWWTALRDQPWIEVWCRRHTGLVLYGEVFGQVQDLKYGSEGGAVFFRAFDVYDPAQRMFYDRDLWDLLPHQQVPVIWSGSYVPEDIEALVSGRSYIPGAEHIREGIVIRPLVERRTDRGERIILKLVSNEYLERA